MKVSIISRTNSNYSINNNFIHFRGDSEELAKLEQLEAKMRTFHRIDIFSRESYLESTSSDISSAKNTIRSLQSYINSQHNNINQLEKMNESAKQTLIKIEPNVQELTNKNKQYQQQIEDLPRYKIEQKNNIMQIIQKKEKENNIQLDTSVKVLNDSIVTEDILKKEIYKPRKEGLGAIAGFNKVKRQIMTTLGEPIVVEKYQGINKVPAGLLLYGPDEINNLDIALATAKQYDCNIVHITDNNIFFELLEKVSRNAKQLFSKEHKRTIIVLDNLEKFIPKETRECGIFKSIMDNISKRYNTTIIATTSHIENLDNKILRDGRFEKIIVPQVTHEDFIAIIKRYISLEHSNYCFEKIVHLLENAQQGGAYTVEQIKSLLQSWSGKLQDLTIKPKIKEETISLFKKQKELIRRI